MEHKGYPDATERHCVNCGKPLLFGRSDRRFCNDGCRNAFNRRKASVEKQTLEHEEVPFVLKTIRNNFRILQTYWQQEGPWVQVPKEYLLQDGFHFGYFTSLWWQEPGVLWLFCFELGLREVDQWYCEIKEREQQMYLDPEITNL